MTQCVAPIKTLLAFSLLISDEKVWFSSLFSAIAVFLYPPTKMLKVLRSLGKYKEKPEILTKISKEEAIKEPH